jgi:hypothetical protein
LYTGADTATTIPTGSYNNNGVDNILLHTALFAGDSNDRPIKADSVIPSRGVPYRVGMEGSNNGLVRVGDGREDGPAAVLLEIEAGVTLRFTPSDANSGILVQGHMVSGSWTTQGALRAVGRAASPITFTSAAPSPAPGDWMGLYFKDAIDPRTRVDQAVIEYAGGNSSSRGVCASNGSGDIDADSAVIIFLQPMQAPPSQFVTNTTIRSSANGGIYRSWYDTEMDFAASNTFESVAGCQQSGIARSQGGCASREELVRLVHGHAKHVCDGFLLVFHPQRVRVVPRALARRARRVHAREKQHLHRDEALAFAIFTAPLGHVEREPPRVVPELLG